MVKDAFDPNGKVAKVAHGSCVAGQIAAAAGNGTGSLGLANDTVVRSYKVYWGDGISDDDLIPAIYKAANDGCRVINLSIAGGPATPALQDAIDYAWDKGCVIVAATGNEGVATVSNPAAMTHVVAVGALAHNASGSRTKAYYSNYGSALDISAPGSSIWGLSKPGYVDTVDGSAEDPGYRWWDGTSMAAPVVAGGIAWLWRAAPWMTNSQIVLLVENTAHDMGDPGRDSTYGHGALDIEAAYKKLIADIPAAEDPDDHAALRGQRAQHQGQMGAGFRLWRALRRLSRRCRAPEQYVGDEREASLQHLGRRARHHGHRPQLA